LRLLEKATPYQGSEFDTVAVGLSGRCEIG
jgi:hypothetical protein